MAWVAAGFWKRKDKAITLPNGLKGYTNLTRNHPDESRVDVQRFENTGNDEDAAYRQAMTWLELEGASNVSFFQEV